MRRIEVAGFLGRDDDPADESGAEAVVFHLFESGNGDSQRRGDRIYE